MPDKILFRFDYSDFFTYDLEKYLVSLKGVKTAYVNPKKEELEVIYDKELISLRMLFYETKTYLKSFNIPLLLGFSKRKQLPTKETIIHVDNICCEYCLKEEIEKLLLNAGVIELKTDYDWMKDANLFITYDETLIKEEELSNLLGGVIVKFKNN